MKKSLLSGLFLCACVVRPCFAADQDQARAATVTELRPKVEFHPAGAKKKALRTGSTIYPGDRMVTLATGEIAFVTADGSLVRLGANTEVTLDDAAKGHNVFDLAKGLLRALVSKQGDGSFTVRTANGSAAVKGTQWQIEAAPDHSEVKVLSGTVEVKDPAADQSVLLHAGEGTITYKDRVAAVRKLDKAEIDALRQAFASKVFQARQGYADRVKKLQGN
jgi:ferric-dicitrate binding protein FerR (iron transport regulator)